MNDGNRVAIRSEASIALGVGLIIAVGASALEAYLVHRTYQYFGGGALNRPYALQTGTQYFIFVLLSVLYDWVCYTIIVWLGLVTLRRTMPARLNAAQRVMVASSLTCLVVLTVAIVKFRIAEYFADKFDIGILVLLSGDRLFNILGWLPQVSITSVLITVLEFLLVAAIFLWIIRGLRYLRLQLTPSTIFMPVLAVTSVLVLVAMNTGLLSHREFLYGMSSKASFRAIDAAIHIFYDYDRNPILAEAAEMTATASPAEIARTASLLHADRPRSIDATNGMNVILIVIETFRSDVVTMEIDGRPVMPFFRKLSERNAGTDYAVSNFGVTAGAIQTLMAGSLHFGPTYPFLPGLLRAAGYQLHGVSAQDERFGGIRENVGYDQFDSYYDATMKAWDRDKLTTWERLNPVALTLTSDEVNEKVAKIVDGAKEPFFLYVNFQDLHFPYFQEGMPAIFIDKGRTDAAFFNPSNADLIRRQYANAAHHLDRALEKFFNIINSRGLEQRSVIVIIGDHPDSIYENGILGHGWSVHESQRRTPLAIINGKGRLTAPVGQDEIFDIIRTSVQPDAGGAPLTIVEDSDKQIFVITGSLEAPRQIAFFGPRTLRTYDFLTGLYQPAAGAPWSHPRNVQEKKEFQELINKWRSELLLLKSRYLRPAQQ